MVSGWSQRRPCNRGIFRTEKYSGLTRLTRTLGFSACWRPMISMSAPPIGKGGVALVDKPASTTSGMAANFARRRSKYWERSCQETWEFLMDWNRQRHRVARVVAEVGVDEAQEAFGCRACRGEEQNRESDLRADHDAGGCVARGRFPRRGGR